jgi:hypothetical protein
MTDNPSIDLSEPDDYFQEYLMVVTAIADLLIRASMDQVATIIAAELGLRITGVNDDGTFSATIDLNYTNG